MDLNQKPNLKPFRDYDPHEKVNGLFALNANTGNKGTFVSILSATGDTNVYNKASGSPITPHVDQKGWLSSPVNYMLSPFYGVTWTVGVQASGGAPPLGCLLYDVRETNSFGENLRYRPEYERAENMYVLPGESVPILKRGLIHTNNFSGVPGPNSGAYVHSGMLYVTATTTAANNVGMFYTTPDKDGYAIFDVKL